MERMRSRGLDGAEMEVPGALRGRSWLGGRLRSLRFLESVPKPRLARAGPPRREARQPAGRVHTHGQYRSEHGGGISAGTELPVPPGSSPGA